MAVRIVDFSEVREYALGDGAEARNKRLIGDDRYYAAALLYVEMRRAPGRLTITLKSTKTSKTKSVAEANRAAKSLGDVMADSIKAVNDTAIEAGYSVKVPLKIVSATDAERIQEKIDKEIEANADAKNWYKQVSKYL